MRLHLLLLLLPLAMAFRVHGQHPVIQAVIEEVRIDSMMRWVGELSGEVPVRIAGTEHTLLSRHKNNPGNDLSQAWLEQKLMELGYAPVLQPFNATGRNILVTKPGNGATEEIVIICAHYDAMPGSLTNAPAADDDGSGVAAVLEAARVLRDIDFVHPIVFALWDEEEQGKIGSAFYAGDMAADDAPIKAVVNMDAIAYDGNGDAKARVHTRSIANSQAIADTVFSVHEQYAIGLDLIRTDPGATYSDHASFWTEGYGAVLIIEEFNADGNPFYHTPNDRVQHFDVPYYEKLAKLSIASTAALAVPVALGTGMAQRAVPVPGLHAHPNPAVGDATAWVELHCTAPARLTLADAMGRVVRVIHDGPLPAGSSSFTVPLSGLPSGGYVLRVEVAGAEPASKRIIRLP
jgi:hypothetical protein